MRETSEPTGATSADLARTDDARLDFERTNRRDDDLELEPITAEDEDSQSSPPDYEISTYPADFTLEVLHKKWVDGEIEIPDFQRGFVWKKVQASRLIESFLVRLPVPAIFLYTERHSEKYLVLDGQQRLRSVFHYFEGHFPSPERPRGPVFRLRGLSPSSHFHNRAFAELPENEQRRLRNSVLRAFVVQQLDPDDDSSMYHIFERLNTGGTLLANQEIRNCIYRGRFVELLEKLNSLGSWRTILGRSGPDSRGKDMELIVRFFATRDLTAYRTPMKRFLSRYMFKNRNASEEALAKSCRLFEETCAATVEALGEQPFHIRAGLNVAVMDAVLAAFSRNLGRVPDDIRSRYRRLLDSGAFTRNTTERTTDTESVRARFRQASESLFPS